MSDQIIDARPAGGPLAWREQWLGIDRNPQAIAFAQTVPGKLAVYVAFMVCYGALAFVASDGFIRLNHVALVGVALALCWVFPDRRAAILSLTGLTYFLLRPFKSPDFYSHFAFLTGTEGSALATNSLLLVSGMLFVAFSYALLINIDRKFLPFAADRPLLFLILVCFGLTVITAFIEPQSSAMGFFWIPLVYIGSTIFFLGYILADHKTKHRQSMVVNAGFLRPFWAGFATPIKGPGYFAKYYPKTDDDLVVARLKGLKLAVWAVVLLIAYEIVFVQLAYGALGIPKLVDLIIASAQGETASLWTRWLAVGVNFIAVVTIVAVAIHSLIAVIRAAGFSIPRGMVRPLASRTIAEFWGRYLFYFKEMLVDLFFYPAFRRYFKKNPKLRMAFATFAAAFIGNIFFDLAHALPIVAMEGTWHVVDRYITYSVYAAVLTAGILWSQMLQRAPKPEDGVWRYSVLPRIQVISFFAIIQVIDDSFGQASLADRLDFLGSLFMIGV